MSRIGKLPVAIPAGVEVTLADNVITVKGPNGTLTQDYHKDIKVEVVDNSVVVTRPDDEKEHRAHHGLVRALVANMVTGVTTGFAKNLTIVGVGYRAQMQGEKLVLNMGYSHPVEVVAPEGVTLECPDPNHIVVKGADKQKVGQVAADIRMVRKPEVYMGKGIRYADEVIHLKAGKAGKKA